MAPEQIQSRTWDAIVVGTGIGGGTIGYALAKAGRSVLFCEKGPSHLDLGENVIGDDWAEAHFRKGGGTRPLADYLRRGGRVSEPMLDRSNGRDETFRPTLGEGTGGTSAIYGMTLERFFPVDFTPRRYFPGATDANLPDAWPITYDELAPYYAEAESLYRVQASRDPLRPADEVRGILPPSPLSASNRDLFGRLEAKGAHPYHLPIACDHRPGCHECIGFICKRGCKGDSATICVQPALRDHGAVLLDNCEVETVQTRGGHAEGVVCRRRGERMALKARTVILAAGAINSPAILLRSGADGRPEGLANASGEVGRNFMRHFLDYYIVYPRPVPGDDDLLKQISLNDFYVVDGVKYGNLQSNGRLPPASSLSATVREDLQKFAGPLARIFPLVKPAVEFGIRRMLAGSVVLASIMEDLPYRENRIALTPDRQQITFTYRISAYDQERIAAYRKMIASLLAPHTFRQLKMAERNRVLGHMCGSCRFGADPKTSVLDRDNRAHELDNLYVVDSSFFPTSGGTNPSLTIAANALRVAERIRGRLPT
jgi:choline dehydrogenase-like flavoprotein